VAVATFETVKSELATLKAKVQGDEVARLVEQGLAEGRLLPAQKEWEVELGEANLAALTKYLGATAPIAALPGSQTGGRAPEKTATNPEGLTAEELAVCTATGIDAKDFAAAKAA
jgi:phage I-like protein